MNVDPWMLSCEGDCKIETDQKTYTYANPTIESHNGILYLTMGEDLYTPSSIKVTALKSGGLITFVNYDRTSYAKNPWNTFRGSLLFQKDKIKNMNPAP